jgi:hypothetical protein
LHGKREREDVRIVFPHTVKDIESAYLLCRYVLKETCHPTKARLIEDRVPHNRSGLDKREGLHKGH